MRTLLGVPIVAVLLAAATLNSAQAFCCGAASYRNIGCCDVGNYCQAKQQCHTVMKTCREVVYEQQQHTCYKKVCETVYGYAEQCNDSTDFDSQKVLGIHAGALF